MNFSKVFRAVPYIAIFAILAIILLVNENLTNKGEFHGKSSPQAGYISLGTYGSNISGPESFNGNHGFPETVAQIMERDKFLPPPNGTIKDLEAAELPYPDRRNLPQDPGSMPEASYPPSDVKPKNDGQKFSPQSISTNFGAITVSEAGFIPPDNMGAVGPTQYIAIANGRIRSFNKTTGSADGALNTTTDNFFNSVRNGSGTSDPRIRYDRLSQKWFVVIINVSSPNRILIAVSNTSTITVSTTWLFYFINAPNRFYDYPTFGIDNNAVYIGTNDFNTALTVFIGCSGYVINKAGLIAGSSTPFLFSLVPNGSSDGPYTPQGVDNFDGSATEGYFIGVSNQFFGRLILRRVSTPGGVPTISSDITVTVNSTYIPRTVPVLGSNRPLDALDDRLFAACIRNGRLWTAHNFNVNSSGVASTTADRDGSRWYELQNLTTTPTVVQSGTIFDPAAADPVNYWIPSVMVSGQGHALFTLSSGGNTARANVSTVGRLSSDALGTTQSILNITNTSSNYNVQVNTTQRWGDYSYVSLDPNDDMTMWSVQEYCNATNSWAEQVTRLLAPPPPTLTSANPPTLTLGQPSINVVITGTSSAGTAFYDPGSGFANRISAAIDGGVIVNSTTYNSQTQVTLNVSTVSATTGSKTVTITNPDGQSVSSSSILSIPLPVLMSSFTFSVDKRNVTLRWATTLEINNKGFDIERRKDNSENWQIVGFVDGHGTSNDPHDYSFNDSRLETGKYYYRLKQIDYNGDYERFTLNNVVAVGVPVSSDLSQNYPNPFNPLTKIDYNIPSDSKVEIKIYDITGREIAELLNEFKPAGYYTAEFDASKIASGIYFYRIFSEGGGIKFTKTMKMLVVK